jgi:hypothetical protein
MSFAIFQELYHLSGIEIPVFRRPVGSGRLENKHVIAGIDESID